MENKDYLIVKAKEIARFLNSTEGALTSSDIGRIIEDIYNQAVLNTLDYFDEAAGDRRTWLTNVNWEDIK